MIISIFNNEVLYGVDLSDRGAQTLTISDKEYADIQSGSAFFDISSKKVKKFKQIELPEPESKVVVPEILTPRQLRLIIVQASQAMGLPITLDMIDAMIDQLPEPDRTTTKILREYSWDFRRHDPHLLAFAKQLEIDDELLDQLFIEWSKL